MVDEKSLKFTVISHSKDGRMSVSINGMRYSYEIGGHQVQRVLDLVDQKKKGQALNFLKKAAGKNFKKEESLVERVIKLWE